MAGAAATAAPVSDSPAAAAAMAAAVEAAEAVSSIDSAIASDVGLGVQVLLLGGEALAWDIDGGAGERVYQGREGNFIFMSLVQVSIYSSFTAFTCPCGGAACVHMHKRDAGGQARAAACAQRCLRNSPKCAGG